MRLLKLNNAEIINEIIRKCVLNPLFIGNIKFYNSDDEMYSNDGQNIPKYGRMELHLPDTRLPTAAKQRQS